jgi:uncharacterized membrane protein
MPHLSATPIQRTAPSGRTCIGAGAAALLVLSAACSEERGVERHAESQVERPLAVTELDRVPCAHAGETLSTKCTIERQTTKKGLTLTVRHPDGAFRRLAVATDGRGVVAADGAEPARVAVIDAATIEVAIGGDHYRLPATVRERTVQP